MARKPKTYAVQLTSAAGCSGGGIKIDGKDFGDLTQDATFRIAGGEVPTLTVTLGMLPIQAMGDVQVEWRAVDGTEITYVEFADGSSFGKPR
jgi:hypothetical protein